MTATRAGIFVVLGVLMAVLMYGLILSLLLCLCALIVFGLTKLTVFRAHQKMVMNVMLGLNAVLVLVGLYFMNHGSSSDTGTQVDRAALPLLIPIFKVFHDAVDNDEFANLGEFNCHLADFVRTDRTVCFDPLSGTAYASQLSVSGNTTASTFTTT
ncbi:hypothetical protein [Lactiplantibacillus plantarum]|uniref:hypothetical protein n=1 Tax=Lactiplantibacillus plantarum TaxID=1590 RepID=UPI00280AE1C0|nr:hypothetical protein [Lactiplantibacillus plantarum]